MTTVPYWGIVGLPGLVYLFLAYTYRRSLENKRIDVERILGSSGILPRYARAFGDQSIVPPLTSDDPAKVGKRIFDLHYHPRAYAFPVAMIMIVSAGATALSLIRGGVSLGLPNVIETKVAEVPMALIAGFAIGTLG